MNDATAAARDHRWQNGPAHQECTTDIDRKHPVPVGKAKIEHRAVRIIAGGAVHKDINATERLECRVRRGLNVAFAADIAGRCNRPCARLGDGATCCRRGVSVEIDTGNRGARLGKRHCDRAADPGAGTGDNRRLARQ